MIHDLALSLRRPEDATGDHPHPHPHPASRHPTSRHPVHMLADAGKGAYGDGHDGDHPIYAPNPGLELELEGADQDEGRVMTLMGDDGTAHESDDGLEDAVMLAAEGQGLGPGLGHDSSSRDGSRHNDNNHHMMASIRKRFSEFLSMGTC